MTAQRKSQFSALKPAGEATVREQVDLGRSVGEQAEAHLNGIAKVKQVVVVRGSEMPSLIFCAAESEGVV
jgi:hypothetical protein